MKWIVSRGIPGKHTDLFGRQSRQARSLQGRPAASVSTLLGPFQNYKENQSYTVLGQAQRTQLKMATNQRQRRMGKKSSGIHSNSTQPHRNHQLVPSM